jgi:hypothetical protein
MSIDSPSGRLAQEFSHRFVRAGAEVGEHRVSVDIRVLDNQITARLDERAIGAQPGQDVWFGVIGIQNDHGAT